MNRTVKALAALFLLLLLLPLVSACAGDGPLDGTYSCVAADTGEVYTFKGNKVNIRLYIMGAKAVDYDGTYKIKDGMIIFDFPKDTDNIYTGRQSVEILDDGEKLRIGDVTFEKGDPKINERT